VGDTVIFRSQYEDLKKTGALVGVLTADPERTLKRYPGVKSFDIRKGRLRGIIAAVSWSDIVIVGGGELVQDDSSLLYSPFNLLPVILAFCLRKKSFAWAVGIGQGRELTLQSKMIMKIVMKMLSGITVRDRGSFNVLYQLGIREPEMVLAADCALVPEPRLMEKGMLIGAAPRDVSNRTRHLLPLELRKKLGIHRKMDPSRAVSAWAKLLDWYATKFSAGVVLFPFHTGTLSNDDRAFCELVAGKMKNSVDIADPSNNDEFLRKISHCRIMVTTPLHGAILAFASNTVPVSVSYSSKCTRFMEQADLSLLVSSGTPGIPDRITAMAVEKAWKDYDSLSKDMEERRKELQTRAMKTLEHFRRTFGL